MAVRRSPFASLRAPDAVTVAPREAAREALEQLRAEQSEKAKIAQQNRRPLREWTKGVPTPQHGPLRFDDFPFQIELYDAYGTHDRELGVRKCTQGGFSEWALRVALFHADRGRTAMYVMPDDAHLKDFSNMRIKPVLRKSEYLRSRMVDGSVDNVGLKEVGLGWVAFRGANSPGAVISVPADVLILDEYDLLDPENLAEAEQRVTGPLSAGLIRRLGVPSLPGWGIDAVFAAGDQRAWTVKCWECDEWNRLEGSYGWARNVDKQRNVVVCGRCREPIDVRGRRREKHTGAEWVARYPDRSVRTYTIPKYAIYGVNVAGIVERSQRKRPLDVEKFHRNDLGEPFTPADARLSHEAILACVRPELHLLEGLTTPRLVTMGVDAKGRGTLHVVISEHLDEYRKRRVWAGTLENFSQLIAVMGLYGVNMAAIDHQPEWQQAMAFVQRFPGRAYRAGFLTGKDSRQATKIDIPMQVDEDEKLALVRRTQVIDTMLTNFRQQFVLLPPLDELPPDYPDHLKAVVRVKETKDAGELKVYYRSIGDDDFALAECYDVMATDLFYRGVGLEAVQLAQTRATPTVDAIDFARSRLSDVDADDYREGLGGRDEFPPGIE